MSPYHTDQTLQVNRHRHVGMPLVLPRLMFTDGHGIRQYAIHMSAIRATLVQAATPRAAGRVPTASRQQKTLIPDARPVMSLREVHGDHGAHAIAIVVEHT